MFTPFFVLSPLIPRPWLTLAMLIFVAQHDGAAAAVAQAAGVSAGRRAARVVSASCSPCAPCLMLIAMLASMYLLLLRNRPKVCSQQFAALLEYVTEKYGHMREEVAQL